MSTKCQYRPAISTHSECSWCKPPADGVRHQRQQPEHADDDVRAVEAGQREEGRAEQVAAERQPFV